MGSDLETSASLVAARAAKTPHVFPSVAEFRRFCTGVAQDKPSLLLGADALFLGSRVVLWFDVLPEDEFHVNQSGRDALLPRDFSFILDLRPRGQVDPPQGLWRFLRDELNPRRSLLRFVWVFGALALGGALSHWASLEQVGDFATGLLVVLTAITSIVALLASALTTTLPSIDPAIVTTPTFYRSIRIDRNVLLLAGIGIASALVAATLARLWSAPPPVASIWSAPPPVTSTSPLPQWGTEAVFASLLFLPIWVAAWIVLSVFPYYGSRNSMMLAARGIDYARDARVRTDDGPPGAQS